MNRLTQFDDALGLDLNFVRNQTRVINTRSYEVEYPEMDFASLLPVNTSYPEWADGVDTYISDKVGEAKWQSGYAKDIPLADVTLQMVTSKFAMYSVGYRWNIEELAKAQFQNFPLSARKAEAARFASELFTWECALYGGGHPGWAGLINSPYATIRTDTPWVNAAGELIITPAQAITRLNWLITGPASSTGVLMSLLADTILLPPLVLQALTNAPYGDSAPNKTVMQYFDENNVYKQRTGRNVVVRDLPATARAATTGVVGGGRAVAYRNSQDILELPMPMAFHFRPVYQDGPLQFTVPGIGRIGQLQIFRQNGIRYMDGISPIPTP